jgi:hypothetical protein
MYMNSPLITFHALLTVYENCRASALGRALSLSQRETKALTMICAFPGITLNELSRVLDIPRAHGIGAIVELRERGYIDFDESDSGDHNVACHPIRSRTFGLDGHAQLFGKLLDETGESGQMEALLPIYRDVLEKSLDSLCAEERGVFQRMHQQLLERSASIN